MEAMAHRNRYLPINSMGIFHGELGQFTLANPVVVFSIKFELGCNEIDGASSRNMLWKCMTHRYLDSTWYMFVCHCLPENMATGSKKNTDVSVFLLYHIAICLGNSPYRGTTSKSLIGDDIYICLPSISMYTIKKPPYSIPIEIPITTCFLNTLTISLSG